MVVEDKYKKLLIGQLKGELDKAEQHELFVWVYEDSSHKKLFYELKDIWDTSKVIQRNHEERQEEEWAKLWGEIEKLERKDASNSRFMFSRRMLEIYKYAAFLIVAFGISWLSLNQFQKSDFNTVVVPYGARINLTLSDGTHIWLNSGTTLKYPVEVKKNDVDVFLSGEAFFDVAHINNRKFNVKTSTINIQVLGTRFNVKSYEDENVIETTLEKGAVSIEGSYEGKAIMNPILLKPNQQATFERKKYNGKPDGAHGNSSNKGDGVSKILSNPLIVVRDKVLLEDYVSWKDNKLIFKSERLGKLARKMERWYDVEIHIEDESLINSSYTGVFEDETIEQAMEALSISLPFDYAIEKNKIRIIKKKY